MFDEMEVLLDISGLKGRMILIQSATDTSDTGEYFHNLKRVEKLQQNV